MFSESKENSAQQLLTEICQIATAAINSHYASTSEVISFSEFNSRTDKGGSIKVNNRVVMKVYMKTGFIRVVYSNTYSQLIDSDEKYKMASYPQCECIDIRHLPDMKMFNDMFLQAFDDSCHKDIGCCSKYKECSAARKCIDNNPDVFLHCYYRRNLQRGKVFY